MLKTKELIDNIFQESSDLTVIFIGEKIFSEGQIPIIKELQQPILKTL